jgi:hypothetical protein
MTSLRSLTLSAAALLAALPAWADDGSRPLGLDQGSASSTFDGPLTLVARKSKPVKHSQKVKHAQKHVQPEPEPEPDLVLEGDHGWDGDCWDGACCGPEFWEHRTGLFGEYLLMRATGNDMAHGFQRNGTVPVGHVGVLDQEHESGFRVGFGWAMDPCSSVGVAFTRVDSHATDFLDSPNVNGGETASLVLHPGFVNAGTNAAFLDAEHDIDMQTIDVDYRRVFSGSHDHVLNYAVGVRYGNLEQNFAQIGTFAQPTGDIFTFSDIDFDGVGLRVGLDGRRRVRGCWSAYGKIFLSMLFGDVQTEFANINVTTETVLAQVDWQDTRLVPVLDYEVGVSWTSCSDRWVLSVGYLTSIWFNAVTTPEFIKAVQADSYVDLGDTINFDGFTARVEFRF